MKIFLLWRSPSPAESSFAPAQVGAEPARLFGPLFAAAPRLARSEGPVHLAWLELPTRGFRAPFLEEDGPRWAFTPEYPLNARRLLRAHGAFPRDGQALLPGVLAGARPVGVA